jgi:7tm Odorant receptor
MNNQRQKMLENALNIKFAVRFLQFISAEFSTRISIKQTSSISQNKTMPRTFDKFMSIMKNARSKALFLGFNFIDEDFKLLNKRSCCVAYPHIISILITSFYSFIIYSGDLEKTVFCFVTFQFLMKALMKCALLIGQRKTFRKIVRKIEPFHEIAEEFGYEEIFHKNLRYCRYVYQFIEILYATVGLTTLLNPWPVLIFTGHLNLPYGFELPYFDPSGTFGYAINYIYALQLDFCAVTGFTAADIYMAMTIIPVFGIFEMLIKMLDDIEQYKNPKDEKEMRKRRKMLHEIIYIHQKLIDLIDELEDFYKAANLMCLGAIIVQCVASLFALIEINWYIGGIIVIMNIFEIFMLCIFGALLEIMQERFRKKIKEVNWIDKDENEKKKILFIMLSTEKLASFTYVLGPLNFETFMTVKFD